MSNKITAILLGIFLFTAAFGPRLVFAGSMPVKNACHQAPVEMPADCAVHCFSKAVAETKVDVAPAPFFDFLTPILVDLDFSEPISEPVVPAFLESGVFRDVHLILTTIKRE